MLQQDGAVFVRDVDLSGFGRSRVIYNEDSTFRTISGALIGRGLSTDVGLDTSCPYCGEPFVFEDHICPPPEHPIWVTWYDLLVGDTSNLGDLV